MTRAVAAGFTRRELPAAAIASALGAAAGAPVAVAAGSASGDHQILAGTLRVERVVVWVYERVLARGRLGPGARATVRLILGHEREHVAALELALGGARTGEAPITLGAAERELRRHHVGASLLELGTQRDSLRLLVDVESMAEGAWFAAIARLRAPGLAALAAAIMASEAQHWTALSAISHHGDPKISVPYPFVRGSGGY